MHVASAAWNGLALLGNAREKDADADALISAEDGSQKRKIQIADQIGVQVCERKLRVIKYKIHA